MCASAGKRIFKGYLWAAAVCLLFGTVYEWFSHGVYTVWMWGAFLIPLSGGLAAWALHCRRPTAGAVWSALWAGGIIWLTAGSLLMGVLTIYGTTNRLTPVYFVLGGAQLLWALAIRLYNHKKRGS